MGADINPINKTIGLVAATFTPFHDDGAVDLSRIQPYAERLSELKVAGAFVNGTTGEGASLTVVERMQMAEAWVNAAPRKLRIFVHVGHTSLPEARKLANHAADIGAHAVACIAPFFFKPRTITELVDWCAAVAAAAPELPFYYYHIPALSGVNLKMAEMLPVVRERIPNFGGMKFTFEDLEDYQACRRFADGRYDLLFGRDEILLTAVKGGAKGAVGTTYNFTASLNHRMMEAFTHGDLEKAEKLQVQATNFIEICIQGDWHPVAAFKWLMGEVGLDCGPARLPIPNLTDDQVRLLRKGLEAFSEAGILDKCPYTSTQE